jgi:hypothetical protein
MSGAANGTPVLGMAHTVNKHASLFAGIDTAEEKKRFTTLTAICYWLVFSG